MMRSAAKLAYTPQGDPPDVDRSAALPAVQAGPPGLLAGRAHTWNALSAVYLFAARVAISVVQLRVVEHLWGGAYSGLNVLSNQVLMYVLLLELGLAQAAISFLYEPLLRGEHSKASALILAVRHDIRKFVLVGFLVVFPALVVYAYFIHGAVPLSTTILTLWLIAFTGFVQLAAVHFQVYLNAAERLGWVNLTLGTGYLAKTAVGLLLAAHFHEYLLLPASTAALTLLEYACLRFAFHRSFPHFREVDWTASAQSIRMRARFALIHKIAGVAYFQSDFIVLSLTASLLVVKDYAKYQYASAALLSMVGTIAAALTSSIARTLLNNSEAARRRQYFALQFAVAVVGAVLMLGYYIAAPSVVGVAFGRAPAIGKLALGLFAVALFLNIVKLTDDVTIIAKGAFRTGFWIPILEAPLYIVLGVVLSRRYGFVGILLASILTNCAVSVITKGFVLAGRVFDATPRAWFLGRAANTIKALALVLPLLLLHIGLRAALHSSTLEILCWSSISAIYVAAILRRIFARSSVAGVHLSAMQTEA